MCGNHYLSKGMTTESEMADAEGSTAMTWMYAIFVSVHLLPRGCKKINLLWAFRMI
jgi:hypothetical protein